ncbi:M16 family metallopeptidase [Leekyejoonella antrihumi]|uniref:Insulinase family protein n=1 Tax=Leekyejoonella antrihumi TaxID=1660198 RepID=A0A563DZ57_9MICO|nr:pitrilysin family protein [Leekyejoonella antrihumi]TWP35281.1 insulinase family protein [Leekyejoonella antrihumi]
MPLEYPIATRRLANGLRVAVSPDHSVPAVTVNLWVDVGSRHEPEGRTGFAHLFEHLMFQGSRNVAEGEHFSALMAQGGQLNATTWVDRTNYFETVPTPAYELALWMEADRHGYLLDALTQENLDNQRDVVKEEKRQRYDNRPYGNGLTDLNATVFPKGHPYHHSTIGSMDDLDAASLDYVHDFYRVHYGPANTVLTLVGDVTVEDGFAAAERYFGPLPARPVPPQPVVEPLGPLTEPVRLDRVEDVPQDRLYLGFRLPSGATTAYLAGELALGVLAGLATSRLYRRLVRREQIATHVSQGSQGRVAGTSMGTIAIDVPSGVAADDVESAVCEELELLGAQGPTPVELEAVVADTERWWLQSLAAQDERADAISQYYLLHDQPEYLNTFLDQIRQVSAAQVQEAAATWLQPRSRAVVTYRKQED